MNNLDSDRIGHSSDESLLDVTASNRNRHPDIKSKIERIRDEMNELKTYVENARSHHLRKRSGPNTPSVHDIIASAPTIPASQTSYIDEIRLRRACRKIRRKLGQFTEKLRAATLELESDIEGETTDIKPSSHKPTPDPEGMDSFGELDESIITAVESDLSVCDETRVKTIGCHQVEHSTGDEILSNDNIKIYHDYSEAKELLQSNSLESVSVRKNVHFSHILSVIVLPPSKNTTFSSTTKTAESEHSTRRQTAKTMLDSDTRCLTKLSKAAENLKQAAELEPRGCNSTPFNDKNPCVDLRSSPMTPKNNSGKLLKRISELCIDQSCSPMRFEKSSAKPDSKNIKLYKDQSCSPMKVEYITANPVRRLRNYFTQANNIDNILSQIADITTQTEEKPLDESNDSTTISSTALREFNSRIPQVQTFARPDGEYTRGQDSGCSSSAPMSRIRIHNNCALHGNLVQTLPPRGFYAHDLESIADGPTVGLSCDSFMLLERADEITMASGINMLPTRRFSSCSNDVLCKQCLICFGDFKDGDELRNLPCFHEFHKACIDTWLTIKRACPRCRSIVPVT